MIAQSKSFIPGRMSLGVASGKPQTPSQLAGAWWRKRSPTWRQCVVVHQNKRLFQKYGQLSLTTRHDMLNWITITKIIKNHQRSVKLISNPNLAWETFQDSWIYHAKSAFSMCSGAGTAECSRAVLQKIVQDFPLQGCQRQMDVRTVALWDSRFSLDEWRFKSFNFFNARSEWEYCGIRNLILFHLQLLSLYTVSLSQKSSINQAHFKKLRSVHQRAISSSLTTTSGVWTLSARLTRCRISSTT